MEQINFILVLLVDEPEEDEMAIMRAILIGLPTAVILTLHAIGML
ncbi:hypothetical protein [Paracoccus litorisediminis]|nr:hypothetical protein [Paracoccus litorisediminis]